MKGTQPFACPSCRRFKASLIGKTWQQSRLHDDRLQRQTRNLLSYNRAARAELPKQSWYTSDTLLGEDRIGVGQVLIFDLCDSSSSQLTALAVPVDLCRDSLTPVRKIYTDVIDEVIVLRSVANNA